MRNKFPATPAKAGVQTQAKPALPLHGSGMDTGFRRYGAVMLVTFSLLSACSLAPPHEVPPTETAPAWKGDEAVPEGRWKPAENREGEHRGAWWEIYGDKELAALQNLAVESNPGLRAAASRVEQARASAESVQLGILPSIGVGGNAVRTKGSGAQPFSAPAPYNVVSATAWATYEPDLFNRVRDEHKARLLTAEAAKAAYKSVFLALQADVAQVYFSLRAMDAERALLRDTVRVRAEGARIMQKRYLAGVVGAQDHDRAMADLDAIRAELAALDSQRAMLENALAVLLGQMPSSFTYKDAPLEGAPPKVPAGLPSTLLERRPDIAGAQDMMAAANARIGVARAAFFPSLTLTASGGYESSALHNLFEWSARTWALGQVGAMALSLPIFDNGRRAARVDEAVAAYEESLSSYRAQVLNAFREVEDNLSAQSGLAKQHYLVEGSAAAAERVLDLAQKRYDAGDADYFEVVDAQRTALAARRAAVQAQGQRFIASVTLIRALGGGW